MFIKAELLWPLPGFPALTASYVVCVVLGTAVFSEDKSCVRMLVATPAAVLVT